MDALLAALVRNPARQAAPLVVAALSACLVAGSVTGAHYAAGGEKRLCRGAAQQLSPAWNDARRAAARRAFEATGLPYADDTWRATEGALSSYASSWIAMRTEACESTRLRGDQSEEVMDLRIECLDRRARDMSLLMDTLENADARVVEHGLAVEDLPSLSVCADVEGLRRPQRPPQDPAKRARLEEVRSALARARAVLAVGKFEAARDACAPLVADARALGHRPLEAEALFVLGDAESDAGDYASAARSLQDAALAAEVGRDVRLEALAYLRLAMVVGPIQREFDRGALLCSHVHACLEQLGRDVPIEAGVMDVEAQLAYLAGHLDEAVATHTRAIQLLEPVAGADDRQVAAMRSFEGFVLADLNRFPEALHLEGQALDSRREALGASHPEVARSLTNLALVHMQLGDAEQALAEFRAARAIWDALDPEHPLAGFAEQGIADALLELGRIDEARTAGDAALGTLSRGYGADHPRVASALLTVGRIALARGALDEAERDYERALALFEAPTSDPLRRGSPLTGLGRVLLARHQPRKALVPLERAFQLFERLTGDANEHADAHIALARALWDSESDRPRSVVLAKRALAEVQHLAPARSPRREIEVWLAAHAASSTPDGGRP
ncbi:MAG: tetratricopeptide repeat protein [Polyangiaceae bacterium]